MVSTPSTNKVDGPLMGNGDVTMTLGYKGDVLSYYLSKNDFWRLVSPETLARKDDVSGPRIAGSVNIRIDGYQNAGFTADQQLVDGITTCHLSADGGKVALKSWVSAVRNAAFIEITATGRPAQVTVELNAPENPQARLKKGGEAGTWWLTRAFTDSVDIATEVAIALKSSIVAAAHLPWSRAKR